MRTKRTEHGKRLAELQNRIAGRLGEKPVVFYSAYKSDKQELPIDNLDEIAVFGKVKFRAQHDSNEYYRNEYVSPVVDSPTWLDVAVLANEMIKTTRDFHHQFLEDVKLVGERNGLKDARFLMGS